MLPISYVKLIIMYIYVRPNKNTEKKYLIHICEWQCLISMIKLGLKNMYLGKWF